MLTQILEWCAREQRVTVEMAGDYTLREALILTADAMGMVVKAEGWSDQPTVVVPWSAVRYVTPHVD